MGKKQGGGSRGGERRLDGDGGLGAVEVLKRTNRPRDHTRMSVVVVVVVRFDAAPPTALSPYVTVGILATLLFVRRLYLDVHLGTRFSCEPLSTFDPLRTIRPSPISPPLF